MASELELQEAEETIEYLQAENKALSILVEQLTAALEESLDNKEKLKKTKELSKKLFYKAEAGDLGEAEEILEQVLDIEISGYP